MDGQKDGKLYKDRNVKKSESKIRKLYLIQEVGAALDSGRRGDGLGAFGISLAQWSPERSVMS